MANPNQLVIDAFNKGNDIAVTIIASTGEMIQAEQMGHLVRFEATEDDTVVVVKPCTRGARPIKDRVPHGWKGKMEFARYNGALANFMATLQANYFNTGLSPKFDIQVLVSNRDGTVDQNVFKNCIFHGGNFGGFAADKEVDQALNFEAEYMTTPSAQSGTLIQPVSQ